MVNPIKKLFAPLSSSSQSDSFVTKWLTPRQDTELLRRYQGYVYACVSAIAEDVAMINFKVYRVLPDGSKQNVINHPLLKILQNPNPLMSKYQFIEMAQTHIELTGESFWYSEIGADTSRPKSFYILPPDRMTVAVDTSTPLPTIAGYIYNSPKGTQIPLDPEEVVHHKMPNPWDTYRGYGTVEASLIYIQTEKFASEFTRNYIYNNAMPAGIVTVKGAIDKDQYEELKAQWKQEYGTLNKAGKTAFIKDLDISFTKVGTTLADSALKDIKDLSRDDIMTMFRVSKPILGIFDDVNLASAKTAQYVFMSRVIDPKMQRMADTLQFVLNKWNTSTAEYVIGYESPVPEDIDDKLKIYTAGLNNWLTSNEIRAKEGLQPVSGGDVIRQPLNLTPIGTPIAPVSTAKSGHTITRTIKVTGAKKKDLSFDVVTKESFRQELMVNQEQWAKKYKTAIETIVAKQRKQVMKNIKQHTSKTKAFEEYMPQDDTSDFSAHLTPLEYELLKTQGAVALALAGANELEFQLNKTIRDDVAGRITRLADNFNAETKAIITSTMTEAYANNESLAQITKRLNVVFDGAEGYRADRIARTETLYVSNSAAEEAYLQTGYVTKEEWFSNPDSCEFCSELDGKVISISQNFVNLGDSVETADGATYNVDYADVGYPPLHPNCTCVVLPVND